MNPNRWAPLIILLILPIFVAICEAKSSRSSSRSGKSPSGSIGNGKMTRTKKVVKKVGKILIKLAAHRGGSKFGGNAGNANANNNGSSEEEQEEVEEVPSVQINGTLLCNGQPASDVLVKFYNEAVFHQLLGRETTDSFGSFVLLADAQQNPLSMQGNVNIYHDCEDDKLCQRKFGIKIEMPAAAAANQSAPISVQLGSVELATRREEEERDCFH